jgi:inhibitor of KinA sporulation pathway (predicted exonuclease)
MRYVIVDLEATCWERGTAPSRRETIEIGAVQLASATFPLTSQFSRFVRPVAEPTLSDFCAQLTSIRQADLDAAGTFDAVLLEFVAWIGSEPFVLASWGAYDVGQFRVDCVRHGPSLPASFERHINLKREFAQQRGIRPCGMRRALELEGVPLTGRHHRATDDVRNIAALATRILPVLEHAAQPVHAP